MKNIKYFPGFDSLRFIAAYLVLTTHIELIRSKYHLFSLHNLPILNEGLFAVEFFFVLSGFLITYLLLKERAGTGSVSIKKFYLRRVLRIWPLYYIIVILGLIIIPVLVNFLKIPQEIKIPFFPTILLYVCMLPNLVTSIYGSSFLSPLWSIGVEEQFYLIWAPAFKFIKNHFIIFLFGIILIRLMLFYIVVPALIKSGDAFNNIISDFILSIRIECMAVGALGAIALFNGNFSKFSEIIFSYWLQVVTIIYFIMIFLLHASALHTIFIVDSSIVHSIFILIFLFNISLNPQALIKLRNKYLYSLGKISYGIYMYHAIVAFAIIYFLKVFLVGINPFWATLLVYSSVSASLITVAYFSFKYIEQPIIKLKQRV